MQKSQKLDFPGSRGAKLSARLDLPDGPVRAYAIFAHCFTCSKDLHATRSIAAELSSRGFAVLRFDFTGLGNSSGDFASTNFSSNREDLLVAAEYLRAHYRAPALLIGHSLGGAAVLSVAGEIPEVKAVATLGAPAEASHVIHNFGAKIDEISEAGEAEVTLGGRKFSIRKQFIDDLVANDVLKRVAALRKPLLVLHSPLDQTVGIENATQIFTAAKHPKSFVSLDNADHLVSSASDARFTAAIIAAWSERYVSGADKQETEEVSGVAHISETGNGKFQNTISVNGHHALADEPADVGGLDSGMSPYDLLAASLGSCTSMTLRMYADFKKIDLGRINVDISHTKIHAKDCIECAEERREAGGKIDVFERRISVEGLEDPDLKAKIVEIADKCPVHRTLEKGAVVKTGYKQA
ncbi:MAG: bifunctional alpha/beta hydrolase/OsmC family protein [Pseudomonadota bacterium]